MRDAVPALLALLVACGSAEEPAAPEAPAAPVAPAAPAEPPAPAAADLGALGIKADLPQGSSVTPYPGGEGVVIMGVAVGSLTILPATEHSSKTVAEEKADLDTPNPENLKEEALADGWVLTYDAAGPERRNYYVRSRRDIGGKGYVCSTIVPEPAQQAEGAAVCKSLKL